MHSSSSSSFSSSLYEQNLKMVVAAVVTHPAKVVVAGVVEWLEWWSGWSGGVVEWLEWLEW